MQLTYNGLDLNASPYGVALNGFLAPPPTIKQQFADSALRHGQVPTEAWKYNNRLLTFAVRVSADTRAELDDAIRALEAEVHEATSLVAYTIDDGQTIYFRAYRPSETDPTAYFDRRYQDALTCIISWSQEAYPFGHIDRMALPLFRGLGRNDSFERREGNDFEDWVEDASGGGIAANTTDYIAGVTSAKLTAGAGPPTSLTDEDFMYVDS
ncbi:MAG: hypothetical protein PHU54_09195, partial [Candidatus Omnitrophica bacterium]|nr:hypothetical protein [Candidatus Omnitrophota bacterium]